MELHFYPTACDQSSVCNHLIELLSVSSGMWSVKHNALATGFHEADFLNSEDQIGTYCKFQWRE